jgi:hypothetical protein
MGHYGLSRGEFDALSLEEHQVLVERMPGGADGDDDEE